MKLHSNHQIKNTLLGTPLVVQRLELSPPNAGGLVSIPGQVTRSHMPQLKIPHDTAKKSPHAIGKIEDPICLK